MGSSSSRSAAPLSSSGQGMSGAGRSDGQSGQQGQFVPARRRPHFRMHGIPIRVTSRSVHVAPAVAQPVRLVRRFARMAFINRNFALLWWGQAISSIGDYAWDT
ncbi:MAG: hypothetical protein ACXWQ5_22475, partial [Ktedonobacterales bacterium]